MGRKFINLERQGASPRPAAKANEVLLYANSEGVKVVDEDGAEWPIGAADPGTHTHPQYAETDHTHGEADHPDLAAHESLGLAAEHDHPFAADDHTHPAGSHPDLAAHELLGLSGDDHTHDTTHNHDGDYAAIHAHPYSADDHAHLEYATDTDLTTHAATTHGTTAHAISGVSHTGSLDHSDLGSVTPNQHHNQAHALGGGDHTGALAQSSVTDLEADLAGKAAAVHTHPYAADDHTHPGGAEAFPVGSIFITVASGNPSTMLGYGTWSIFGAGRFLLGVASNGTAEATAGAATHAHTFSQPSDHAALTHAGATVGNHAFTQPGAHADHAAQAHSAHSGATVGNHADVTNHVHVQNINTATTGGLVGFPALKDTSTSGSEATGLSTANPTSVGVAAMVHTVGQASAHSDHAALSHSAHSGGAVDAHSVGQANQHAAQSHAGGAVANGNTDPLSITAFMWKRTA